MSADCFPDQVSAPLASTLMIRSTVRWARTGSSLMRQGRWAWSFSWVKAAHAMIRPGARKTSHRPLPLRKIQVFAGPSRVAFLFFGQCKLTCFLSVGFGRGQAQYLP